MWRVRDFLSVPPAVCLFIRSLARSNESCFPLSLIVFQQICCDFTVFNSQRELLMNEWTRLKCCVVGAEFNKHRYQNWQTLIEQNMCKSAFNSIWIDSIQIKSVIERERELERDRARNIVHSNVAEILRWMNRSRAPKQWKTLYTIYSFVQIKTYKHSIQFNIQLSSKCFCRLMT